MERFFLNLLVSVIQDFKAPLTSDLYSVRMRNQVAVLTLIVLGMVSCAKNDEDVWVIERSTLSSCLSGIEATVRDKTAKVVSVRRAEILRDKPDEVTGWFEYPDLHFWCKLQRTGTRGDYWKGVVFIKRIESESRRKARRGRNA